jgi:DNA-binding FadR family transcriptional regulator
VKIGLTSCTLGSRPVEGENPARDQHVDSTQSHAREPIAAEQVVAYVRGLIEKGALRPGDRLASERELVREIGVSRRAFGRLALARDDGVVTTRQGAGTFITAGRPPW